MIFNSYRLVVRYGAVELPPLKKSLYLQKYFSHLKRL